MKRTLLPVLVLILALALTACGGGGQAGPKFGALEVTMEQVAQTEQNWTAAMVVRNKTDRIEILEYLGEFRYVLVITKGKNEVARIGFDPMDPAKAEVVNLGRGAERRHVVAWNFMDSQGVRVAPGTYEARVELNAATARMDGQQVVGPAESGKVVGPVKITVK